MRLFLLKMFREIYANFSINIDFFDLIIYYSNHFLSFLSFSVEIVNRPPSLSNNCDPSKDTLSFQ